ncbi:MAG: hypothetical protein ACMXYF_05460 [Candidatus Woesearchaeota archaeon]
MKKTILLTLVLVLAITVVATPECKIASNECPDGEVGLFSFYNMTNTHVTEYNPGVAPYHMCCQNVDVEVNLKQEQCLLSERETQLFALYQNVNDASITKHAGIKPGFVTDDWDRFIVDGEQRVFGPTQVLCMETTGGVGRAMCTYEDGSCNPNQIYLGSLYTDHNSHYTYSEGTGTALCCEFAVENVEIEGVRICGVDYFCGEVDGVCPEHYVGDNGETADCGNVFDPDCFGTLSFVFDMPQVNLSLITGVSNTLGDSVTFKEYMNQTHYLVQVEVYSRFSHDNSQTQIQLGPGAPSQLQTVYLDSVRSLSVCSGTSQFECFTYDSSTGLVTIYHPLSNRMVTLIFLRPSITIPYLFLFIVFASIILIAAIAGKLHTDKYKKQPQFEKLERYIRLELTKGKTKEQIREKLLSVGWDEKHIDPQLNSLEKHHK